VKAEVWRVYKTAFVNINISINKILTFKPSTYEIRIIGN